MLCFACAFFALFPCMDWTVVGPAYDLGGGSFIRFFWPPFPVPCLLLGGASLFGSFCASFLSHPSPARPLTAEAGLQALSHSIFCPVLCSLSCLRLLCICIIVLSASTVPPQQIASVSFSTALSLFAIASTAFGIFSSPDVRQCWLRAQPALVAPAFRFLELNTVRTRPNRSTSKLGIFQNFAQPPLNLL
jgi:hypothetical protein